MGIIITVVFIAFFIDLVLALVCVCCTPVYTAEELEEMIKAESPPDQKARGYHESTV